MNDFGVDMNGVKAAFIDLDGTIYHGEELIDGAIEFLAKFEYLCITFF